MKSRASTPPPPPPPAFCFTIWFPQQRERENQRQNFLNFLFENTRESQQKKRDSDLDQLQSRSLFSSPLSSFSSSFTCSSATLLLQAMFPTCWELDNGYARTAHAGNQRTVVPAPLVLGTRERLCPFHPCRGPESRPAFCDGPDPAPHGGPGR